MDLAKALVAACETPSNFKFLYSLNSTIKEKIEIISREMYGAAQVTFTDLALKKIKQYEDQVKYSLNWYMFYFILLLCSESKENFNVK